jgi:hypothetical protein
MTAADGSRFGKEVQSQFDRRLTRHDGLVDFSSMLQTAVESCRSQATVPTRNVFRVGYILSRPADFVWFLALPFAAVLIALGCQAWLSFLVVASVNLWITVPHHYATWVRSYGMPEEWHRFKDRLILGPILLIALAAGGLMWAPITFTLLVLVWDHQHSIMQQYGFARIYDFKAGTGLASTRRVDLALHWVLYSHMILNAPMFQHLWLRGLYQMNVRVSVPMVEALTTATWVVLVSYLLFYAVHVWKTVSSGKPINPMKYAFIFSSYFLWYFVAWNTNSILLYGVAHRLMHGVQYMVMVYAFLHRNATEKLSRPGLWSRLAGEGRLKWFLLGGGAYALLYQLMLNHPLDEFGFGVVNFASAQAIPQFNIPELGFAGGYELFSLTLLNFYGMTHYYVDSFIWKVRDKKVQRGL